MSTVMGIALLPSTIKREAKRCFLSRACFEYKRFFNFALLGKTCKQNYCGLNLARVDKQPGNMEKKQKQGKNKIVLGRYQFR